MQHEFKWRGEHIPDINKWAAEHEEKMIKYKASRKVVSHFTKIPYEESYTGEMPLSFYFSLAASQGWMYEMLEDTGDNA